jgi:hypothetical protein
MPYLARMLDDFDPRDPDAACSLLAAAADHFRGHPDRRGATVHLHADSESDVVLAGDLHDHPLNTARLIKLADLDRHPHRHLVLQEIIHGEQRLNDADLSIRAVLSMCALVKQHSTRVHVLLSNHELAQMHNEGILKDGQSVCEAFTAGLEFLYNDDAERVAEAFAGYVKSLPLAVRTKSGLFFSHSLPAPRRIESFDKTVIDRELTEEDYAQRGSAYDMVWGRHHNKKITQELADAWGVRTFVLGHQPAEMGYEAVADNTLIINSDHDHGVALVADLVTPYRRDELYDKIVPLNSVMTA